jgi:NADPH:quinone reductase-like Zn-dependent oxidoreductase
MRAVVLTRHGPASSLRVSTVRDPAPGSGEVRVRVRAIGVNWAEILSRKGLYTWAPPLPYVLGMEAYGEIDAVGPGVAGRHVGEPVIVGAQTGTYAEMLCVDEGQARPALAGFSPDENAAFAVNYMTAWVALFEMARLRPSDRVLVQAAAGGVGTAAVQLAKRFGCTVYGTAGSDEKTAALSLLGIDRAVNYLTHDFETDLRSASGGRGVDVVLELVGGEVYRKSLRLLAPFGRVVVAGFASMNLQRWNPLSLWRTWRAIPRADVRAMAIASQSVGATHIGYLLPHRERMAALWTDLTAFVTRHGIRPVIGSVFPLEEIARGHERLESRANVGKVVVRI